jgi:hypothetical protein
LRDAFNSFQNFHRESSYQDCTIGQFSSQYLTKIIGKKTDIIKISFYNMEQEQNVYDWWCNVYTESVFAKSTHAEVTTHRDYSRLVVFPSVPLQISSLVSKGWHFEPLCKMLHNSNVTHLETSEMYIHGPGCDIGNVEYWTHTLLFGECWRQITAKRLKQLTLICDKLLYPYSCIPNIYENCLCPSLHFQFWYASACALIPLKPYSFYKILILETKDFTCQDLENIITNLPNLGILHVKTRLLTCDIDSSLLNHFVECSFIQIS